MCFLNFVIASYPVAFIFLCITNILLVSNLYVVVFNILLELIIYDCLLNNRSTLSKHRNGICVNQDKQLQKYGEENSTLCFFAAMSG